MTSNTITFCCAGSNDVICAWIAQHFKTVTDAYIVRYVRMDKLLHYCFQGSLSTALEMVDLAKSAGADCAKFQTSSLPDRFTRSALEKPYIGRNSFGSTYGEHRATLELSQADLQRLSERCAQLGMDFFSTANDLASADVLLGMGVPAIKLGSADVANWHLMEHLAKHKEVRVFFDCVMLQC